MKNTMDVQCQPQEQTYCRSNELRGRLNLESIGRCVQNRKLCWFGHIERMDKSFWVSTVDAEQLRCQVQLVEEGQRKHGKK